MARRRHTARTPRPGRAATPRPRSPRRAGAHTPRIKVVLSPRRPAGEVAGISPLRLHDTDIPGASPPPRGGREPGTRTRAASPAAAASFFFLPPSLARRAPGAAFLAAAESCAALRRSGRAVLIYRCLAGLLIDRRGRGRDAAPIRQPGAGSPRGRRAAGESGPARGRSAVGSASVGGAALVPAVRVTFRMRRHVSSGAGRSLPRGLAAVAGRGRERSPVAV